MSIQTGCSNVYIHNVNCGPGHGISIGGLGKENTKACVSNITVRDIVMRNTMNGVRIKTWQVKISYIPCLGSNVHNICIIANDTLVKITFQVNQRTCMIVSFYQRDIYS